MAESQGVPKQRTLPNKPAQMGAAGSGDSGKTTAPSAEQVKEQAPQGSKLKQGVSAAAETAADVATSGAVTVARTAVDVGRKAKDVANPDSDTTLGDVVKDAAVDAAKRKAMGAAADKFGSAGATAAGAAMNSAGRRGQTRVADTGADEDEDSSFGGTAKKVAGTTAAAGAGASFISFVMSLALVQMLKNLVMAMVFRAAALLAKLANMALGFLKSVFAPVLKLAGLGAKAASWATGGLLHGGSAMVTSAAVMATTTMMMVGSIVGVVMPALKDPLLQENCQTEVAAVASDVGATSGGTNTPASAQMLKNAQVIYSVFSGWGMPKENIAGILGNYEIESAIDPTSIETKEGVEPYTYGPQKQQIEASTNFEVMKLAPSYAAQFPGVAAAKYVGIGLQQWTGEGDLNLRAFAKANNRPWYDINLQLAFLRSPGSTSTDGDLTPFIQQVQPSPGDAAEYYMNKYERPATRTSPERRAAAEKWFAQMGTWTSDKNLADDLLAMAGASATVSAGQSVSDAVNASGDTSAGCLQARTGVANNSSAAMAALSYAWPSEDQSRGNDGTPLYQELHRYIFPGDPWFMSCDRSVAVAVRWSGTDDTYPAGPVEAQISYMATSPKWQTVDWGGDKTKLQPGDIMINYHNGGSATEHVIMYVGSDLVQQAFAAGATPGSEIVSGSFGTRSPGAGVLHMSGSYGYQDYTVFRSTGGEANSQYKSYVPTSSTTAFGGMAMNAAGGQVKTWAPGSKAQMPMAPGTYSLGAYWHKVGSWSAWHTGQDMPAAIGTPVYAVADGVVTNACGNCQGWAGDSVVVIKHANGASLYAHMGSRTVQAGQSIKMGQLVGYVGLKGRTFGAHLHFEYYPSGVVPGQVYSTGDPIRWLRGAGVNTGTPPGYTGVYPDAV